MSMAVVDVSTPTSEARAALVQLSEINAELARLQFHLARLASECRPVPEIQLGIAYQVRKSARNVAAMVEQIEQNANRAKQLAYVAWESTP